MSESRKTGLLRLRHLMEAAEAVDEKMAIERERFARLASDSSAPRVVSTTQLFQTPEPLAARVAALLGEGRTFGRVLEPSAGLGRLYSAVRHLDATCPIVLVDNAPDCCRELYFATEADPAATLVQADFLACDVGRLGLLDSVLMNPPFRLGSDCQHVRHALTLLRPGGRLVSLVANGPRQRTQLRPLATDWIDLPAGSFASEGTTVNAAILIIQT